MGGRTAMKVSNFCYKVDKSQTWEFFWSFWSCCLALHKFWTIYIETASSCTKIYVFNVRTDMTRVNFDVKVPAVRGQKLWFFPWAIRMEGGGRQECSFTRSKLVGCSVWVGSTRDRYVGFSYHLILLKSLFCKGLRQTDSEQTDRPTANRQTIRPTNNYTSRAALDS